MLVKEMLVIKDVMKRKRIHVLYQNCVLESVFADSDVICRAKEISKFAGTTSFDSLHLAISEKMRKCFDYRY